MDEYENALAHLATAYLPGSVYGDALRAGIEALRAVREAPVGECMEIGDDEAGQPCVLIHSTRDELRKGPPLAFRKVRLVPVPHDSEVVR